MSGGIPGIGLGIFGQLFSGIQQADAAGQAKRQLTTLQGEEQALIDKAKAEQAEQLKTPSKIAKRDFDEGILTGQKFDASGTIKTGSLGVSQAGGIGGKTLIGS